LTAQSRVILFAVLDVPTQGVKSCMTGNSFLAGLLRIAKGAAGQALELTKGVAAKLGLATVAEARTAAGKTAAASLAGSWAGRSWSQLNKPKAASSSSFDYFLGAYINDLGSGTDADYISRMCVRPA
jgi:hypothetical protein